MSTPLSHWDLDWIVGALRDGRERLQQAWPHPPPLLPLPSQAALTLSIIPLLPLPPTYALTHRCY